MGGGDIIWYIQMYFGWMLRVENFIMISYEERES